MQEQMLCYEYAGNELTRHGLQVEQVFAVVDAFSKRDTVADHLEVVDKLSQLIVLASRTDLRSKYIRFFHAAESYLLRLQAHPQVDSAVLTLQLRDVRAMLQRLYHCESIITTSLRDNHFFRKLRQQSAKYSVKMQLPELWLWGNQPLAQRRKDIARWSVCLQLLRELNSAMLLFLRKNSNAVEVVTANGCYQHECASSQQQLHLLQIIWSAQKNLVVPCIKANFKSIRISFNYLQNMHTESISASARVQYPISFRLILGVV